jgi:hypothetical protein
MRSPDRDGVAYAPVDSQIPERDDAVSDPIPLLSEEDVDNPWGFRCS